MKKITSFGVFVFFEINDSKEYQADWDGFKWNYAALDEFWKQINGIDLILNTILVDKSKKIAVLDDVKYTFTLLIWIFNKWTWEIILNCIKIIVWCFNEWTLEIINMYLFSNLPVYLKMGPQDSSKW